MSINPRQRGKWGERIAAGYLSKKGYTVIATGFRSRFGEIDIIAESKECIVFAEVKTRRNSNFAHAKEFVNKSKQRKIIATANYWLALRPTQLQPRFDVIEIYTNESEHTLQPEINHLDNAFGV